MKWKDLSKYLGLFIFAVAVIAVYKTFDNIGVIFGWFGSVISLLRPFVIGFVIAYILINPCRFIEKLLLKQKNEWFKKNRRPIAVVIIYALFLLIITLVLVAVIPAIVSNLIEFYNNLPDLIKAFVGWFNSLELGITLGENTMRQLFENNFFSMEKLLQILDLANVNRYAQGIMNVGSGLVSVLMGLIVSIYTLIDRAQLKNGLSRLSRVVFKDKSRSFIIKYLRRINEFANKYIYCILVDAVIIFFVGFLILTIAGVQYAPLLALMLGTFNMVPYFGAIIATAVTAIITMFTGSFTQAIVILVILIVLQQIDANLIQPKLYSGSLKVKPFWVIFAILLGGGLLGPIGIFLAVPLTAMGRSVLIDFMEYREAKQGIPSPPRDEEEEEPEKKPSFFKKIKKK